MDLIEDSIRLCLFFETVPTSIAAEADSTAVAEIVPVVFRVRLLLPCLLWIRLLLPRLLRLS